MSPPPRPSLPTWSPAALASVGAALVAGALLRLYALGARSLWLDELFTIRVARHETWAEMLVELSQDVHPPLYFALMRLWSGIAGQDDMLWRLPSALAGLGTIALTAVLARRLAGPLVGALAPWLVALSPMAVELDREVRGNSLLVLFGTGAAALAAGAEEDLRLRSRLLFGLLCAAAAWTHVFGLFLVLGLLVFLATWGELPHPVRRAWIGPGAFGLASFAAWLPILRDQASDFAEAPWYQPPGADSLGWLWTALSGDLHAPAALLLGAVFLGMVRGPTAPARLLLIGLFSLVLLPQVTSYALAPILRPRNVLQLVPLLAVAAAVGLSGLRVRLLTWAAGLLFSSLAIGTVRLQLAAPPPEQWREAAADLVAVRGEGEPVFATHPVLWWYYLGREIDPQSLDGPLPDAAPVLWILEGHERRDAVLAGLRARARVQEVAYLGAWRSKVEGLQGLLGSADFGEQTGEQVLHLYSSGPHRSRELRLYGRCAAGVSGSGDAPEQGPARVALRLKRGEETVAERVVDLGPEPQWTEPVEVGEPMTVELEFANDAVGEVDGMAWDRNAHVDGVTLRCE